ncbi:PREDICTED: transmembrane protein 261-like [Elephantulus edwardii]|uniref:transmembrane protein 261-like n=1 Tax=Elephantulus edwardii TaxID=28737 RepID=UPI0003F0B774|nr:PREDICTED: transmembrane protein 261-like [Elephantulus edwardii]
MGSTVSQPLDQVPIAAPPKIAAPASPTQDPVTNCWSCRVLSGTGLIGAGGYVYWTAKRLLKLGYAPRPGQIAQMVIGISLAVWGLVILLDPKKKTQRAN